MDRTPVWFMRQAGRYMPEYRAIRANHTLLDICARPELAAEDKDIVITATASREPVLNGHWIAEGTHINAIGSNFLSKAEIDAVTVRRCESIVVDSKEQAKLEAGDIDQAI